MTREQFKQDKDRLQLELASNTASVDDIVALVNTLVYHIVNEQPSIGLTRRTLAYFAREILDTHNLYDNKLTRAAALTITERLVEAELCN